LLPKRLCDRIEMTLSHKYVERDGTVTTVYVATLPKKVNG
jgi:hypothetical protein